MNPIISVGSEDFTLQSLNSIGTHLIKKDAYVLLIKSFRCRYCVEYQPIYEQFATQFPNVGFLTLEAGDNQLMLEQWRNLIAPVIEVGGYPTLAIYDSNGHPTDIKVQSRGELNKYIMQVLI